ncbi:MAG TPA: hypothetical protein ENO08_04405 [Candidatus Eisenbacteria bacterium]|uniref:Helicase HerA central domain-containing protein n=1 Tax=Eiseniibacteriota bacterium TaxID=2212470 RepID=A0A7V2F3C8_UNCEI|nr:hypothetical protein [Candidatus Eisenbacteria bacterium]
MVDLEKLGAFYLGRGFDMNTRKALDEPIMYDARDLTTHAVCVGMTGSGKTGLCIDILEEAALDSVPAIIIDPKGDMTNLLLTFPELRPSDFKPWINIDDARRKDMSVDEYAEKIAGTWRSGLAEWNEGPERIRRLEESAEFTIYTPGSGAGVPVSILSSFAAPLLDWQEHEETLREKVQGTVSALLGLAGIEADPVRSREHILLSNIFERAWRNGEDLDIAAVIGLVQKPPMRTLGVFDIDTFFPEKDRFALAMELNNLIAAPGFERWLEGQPLDIADILSAEGGRPRMSIFYIAHLNDAERMFFVTLLLEQILTWMRAQPGTTSLRALVYFDEVFGFFPPVAEPPSKRPLLTLFKQARAFGLGMMLTTQNPVDLDYKGLTNAGTWFIGKLQTERDKNRVLEGLESVVSEAGTLLDRSVLDKLISSLDSRIFLLHNVHQDGPIVFQTRWAMSYLRGPLTRQQVAQLMEGRRRETAGAAPGIERGAGHEAAGTAQGMDHGAGHEPRAAAARAEQRNTAGDIPAGLSAQPPTLPPSLPQTYIPSRISAEEAVRRLEQREQRSLKPLGIRLVYQPMGLGMARVSFIDRKMKVDEQQDVALLFDPPDSAAGVNWEDAERLDLAHRDLSDSPARNVLFDELPAGLSSVGKLGSLKKDFSNHLYKELAFTLSANKALGLTSRPGETEKDFAARCRDAAREARDAEVDKLSDRYERKLDLLRDRLARKERDLMEDEAAYQARKREEMLSAGESVLSVFLGRRSSRAISTAARKRSMTAKAKADIGETQAELATLREDVAELQAEMDGKAEEIARTWEEALVGIEEVHIRPRRTDISVDLVALAWTPYWEVTFDDRGRERTSALPAFRS